MTTTLERFTDASAVVLVLSFDDVEAVAHYRQVLELPLHIASDPDRSTYRAYGLTRGSRWQVYHPRTLWRYLELVAGGMKLHRPDGDDDRSQLGGDFLIDAEGIITFAHRSLRPDDRPPVGQLLEALKQLGGPR